VSEHIPKTESEIVELVRSIDVRAPQELHRQIDALVAERGTGTRRRGPLALRWGLTGVATACAIVLVLVLGLSGGASAPLSLRAAVALTLRPATMPAPAHSPSDGARLAADVEGVPFPYWGDSFGWRSTGERTDRVGGRSVVTVFYAGAHHQWLGYAIVAGSPAPRVGGGVLVRRGAVSYRLLGVGAARVVTWLRDGRLCVLAGHGVSAATMLALASWHDPGASAS
jgi:hypothetical protein